MKKFILFATIFVVGLVLLNYSVYTKNVEATVVSPTPSSKIVTIDTPELSCGEQNAQFSGSLVWNVTTGSDWLVVKLDTNTIYELNVNDTMTSWQTGLVSVSEGNHDLEAIIYDSKTAGGVYQNLQTSSSTDFEVNACLCEIESWSCEECQSNPPDSVCYDPFVNYCGKYFGCSWNGTEERCIEQEKKWICTDTCEVPNTDDGDICANIDGIQTNVPDGKHLDASGLNCVEFGVPGAPEPAEVTLTPAVLGASSMAGTGVAEENIFSLVFAIGSLLSAFGIRKNSSSRVK